jgi:prepilin-type N-terminal cleavage/methylation domain-containing protein
VRSFRPAFTLIELMVSISILSILIIYLHGTLSSLNLSNELLKSESKNLQDIQKIKKVIYMDFSLALYNSVKINNINTNEDFVTMQGSNSIYRRFNPYITYMVKDEKLYRLESLKPIDSNNIPFDMEFDADFVGEVKDFRVYISSKSKNLLLVNIGFLNSNEILYKVKILNEY